MLTHMVCKLSAKHRLKQQSAQHGYFLNMQVRLLSSRPPVRPFTALRASISAPSATAMAKPKPVVPDLSGFLERIKENNCNLEEMPTLTPFHIAGKEIGKLKPAFVDQLARFPDVFQIQGRGTSGKVAIRDKLETSDARTKAVAQVMETLRAEGYITGWRDELYPVTSSFYSDPVMLVERAAATHFGIKAYGVHINGYVRHQDGSVSLWIARRSLTKPNWPGKLDHIAAGGQPHGLSPTENVIKECGEEAGISEDLACKARPVGAVSYMTISKTGLKPDVLFVYDIELPEDFVPKAVDGEVEEFMLWPVDKVAETVANTEEFKTNCNLVIIDFLVRHGFIHPDQPGYLEIVNGLRMGDCS